MFESIKEKTGAAKLEHPIIIAGIVILSVILSFAIAKGGLPTVIGLIILLPALVYLNRLFSYPTLGVITLLLFSFVAIGLTRYIVGVPLGLGVDGLLILSYIAIFSKIFIKKLILIKLTATLLIFCSFGLLMQFSSFLIHKL